MGTSMLQRSQTTSSHIKVINKNSSSAELQSLFKLHHESAKKREEARGYSTAIGVFEGAGGGNFSEADPQRDRSGAQFLQHFRCAALFEPSQWVSGDPVGGRTSASPRGAWPCSARSARSSNAAIFASSKLSQVRVGPPRCWSMSEASGFLHAARPRSADPWGMLETCSNIPMGIGTKYHWRAPEGRPAGRAGPRRPGRCTGSMAIRYSRRARAEAA